MTLPGGQLTMTHDLIPVTGLHGLTLPALFTPNAPVAKL